MAEFYLDPFAFAGRDSERADAWASPSSSSTAGGASAMSGATGANLAAAPQIAQLTQLINSINQTAQQRASASRIPGGAVLEAASSGNISQALAGQLPQDVINLIGQQAAERGVMTGSPLGPGSNAAYLRALGRTSLDLMGQGQNWLTAAQGRNPAAPLFDPSGMFITPGQFGSLEMERLRLPRPGGASGPSTIGGAPTMTVTEGGVGSSVNWADLFGGDGRGLTYGTAVNDFPYGVGTGSNVNSLFMDDSGYTPFIPFGSSFGGQGLWEDQFQL